MCSLHQVVNIPHELGYPSMYGPERAAQYLKNGQVAVEALEDLIRKSPRADETFASAVKELMRLEAAIREQVGLSFLLINIRDWY